LDLIHLKLVNPFKALYHKFRTHKTTELPQMGTEGTRTPLNTSGNPIIEPYPRHNFIPQSMAGPPVPYTNEEISNYNTNRLRKAINRKFLGLNNKEKQTLLNKRLKELRTTPTNGLYASANSGYNSANVNPYNSASNSSRRKGTGHIYGNNSENLYDSVNNLGATPNRPIPGSGSGTVIYNSAVKVEPGPKTEMPNYAVPLKNSKLKNSKNKPLTGNVENNNSYVEEIAV
jgi:hypothetical protein